jgi:hypothetical protein
MISIKNLHAHRLSLVPFVMLSRLFPFDLGCCRPRVRSKVDELSEPSSSIWLSKEPSFNLVESVQGMLTPHRMFKEQPQAATKLVSDDELLFSVEDSKLNKDDAALNELRKRNAAAAAKAQKIKAAQEAAVRDEKARAELERRQQANNRRTRIKQSPWQAVTDRQSG